MAMKSRNVELACTGREELKTVEERRFITLVFQEFLGLFLRG